MKQDLPNIDSEVIKPIDQKTLFSPDRNDHPPRIPLLYGSVRERSPHQGSLYQMMVLVKRVKNSVTAFG